MNSQPVDLATLTASPQQRRAALVVIVMLGALALGTAPFAQYFVGTFPGFVMLYGGVVLTGLAITTTILFGQYAVSRKPSLLTLACGTLFTSVVFVPYLLTFPGVGAENVIGAFPGTASYLWIVWHSALPVAFLAYPLIEARTRTREVASGPTTGAVVASVVAAYAAIHVVLAFSDVLPPLVRNDQYSLAIEIVFALVALCSAAALLLLLRRAGGTVLDAWLSVPAAALLFEAVINGFGGGRYTVGWYLS
ncbi:MAG TPA: MASE4 domain-containing protein, partial [Candidatus Acidoferrum sp.]|nr:MASE4 domain-containing protein [Candidatus Acidoferrum sp.]